MHATVSVRFDINTTLRNNSVCRNHDYIHQEGNLEQDTDAPKVEIIKIMKEFLKYCLQLVGSMQECRKWHFGWNWVLYRYWKYIQKHTIQALHQVPTQTNDNFRAKIRCQKTRKNKGILSVKWLLLQNDQNALTTLLHWADELSVKVYTTRFLPTGYAWVSYNAVSLATPSR